MSSKSNQVDYQIQQLLSTKGFPYVVNELSKWTINKQEHLRAYSPEDTEDLKMYNTLTKQLNELLFIYK